MSRLKKIELSLLFGLLFSVALSFAGFESKCDTLRNGVFRLRIIANSDSDYDQALKLAVRDEILNSTEDIFADCSSLSEAKTAAKLNIKTVNDTVERVLRDSGSEYSFESEVKKEYFGTREYDNFTLPAGEYDSLVIRLGSAQGHNWWCVLFPGVCLPAASKKNDLNDVFSEDTADVAYNSQKYEIRFKAAEIYEKIVQKYKKK